MRPRCLLGVRMVVVRNDANLITRLVSLPTVDAAILGDPCLSQQRPVTVGPGTAIDDHCHMAPTTACALRQHDIARVPAPGRYVTRPRVADISEIPLQGVLPDVPRPCIAREVSCCERLTPLMVRRDVIAPGHQRGAVRVRRRVHQPAVPVAPVVERPPVGLTVPDIGHRVVARAGRGVVRHVAHTASFRRCNPSVTGPTS